MRTWPSVYALSLLLVWSGASAQSDLRSTPLPSASSKDVGSRAPGKYEDYLHARITSWYEDCLKGWNAASHMSQRHFERVCLEMARERIKFIEDEAKRKVRAK
jgi:hypothetical protein